MNRNQSTSRKSPLLRILFTHVSYGYLVSHIRSLTRVSAKTFPSSSSCGLTWLNSRSTCCQLPHNVNKIDGTERASEPKQKTKWYNPGMYSRTPMQVNYKSSPFNKSLDITTETK
jgi:hypothetical protein